MPHTINLKSLRARQPKELLRSDIFNELPPEDLTPQALTELERVSVLKDPAKVIDVVRKHQANGGGPDPPVLIRAFIQLGFLFDPNSFFATADKQRLTGHKYFRELAHDLAQVRAHIPDAAAPVLLYTMTCLEYRCAPLMPTLLDAVERHLLAWRTEVLSLLLHSLTALGLAGQREAGERVVFDVGRGELSRDYSNLCVLIARELGKRALAASSSGADAPGPEEPEHTTALQDWSRAAFALTMAGLYDVIAAEGDAFALPALVAQACSQIGSRQELDNSGWAQFFLYQTLYCVDVEKPGSEEAVKRAMPMWIQERLHEQWLDSIVLQAQPQGADELQKDVDASLKRTNTQALINCSTGRDWDEQHCWFAGFLVEPRVAIECDSLLPLQPGEPRPSGWLQLKSRLLKKMGYTVVTIHRCIWDKLTEDQKDEQILRLRAEVGYRHDKELEKKMKPVRQTAHTYKGIEAKKKDWFPEPSPASE